MVIRRNGMIRIVKKLDAVKYAEVIQALLRKRMPSCGRTTTYNKEITTWCSIKIRDDSVGMYYISYTSNNDGITVNISMWKRDKSLEGKGYSHIKFIIQ
jgi:hypothetical protein